MMTPCLQGTVVSMRNPIQRESRESPGSFTLQVVRLSRTRDVIVLLMLLAALRASRRQPRSTAKDRTDDIRSTSSILHQPSARESTTLRIELLGSFSLSPLMAPLSDFGRAFVCYLALHSERPQTPDELQTALWPNVGPEGDVSRKTFLNNVSQVRAAIGKDHLPVARARPSYALHGISCDWFEFTALVAKSEREDLRRGELLERALRLVRGVPLESELSRYYHWADADGTRARIERAVVAAATSLASLAKDEGDHELAGWALRQGLLANPYDHGLWRRLLELAQARGDAGEIARCERQAQAVLGEGAVPRLRAEREDAVHRDPR